MLLIGLHCINKSEELNSTEMFYKGRFTGKFYLVIYLFVMQRIYISVYFSTSFCNASKPAIKTLFLVTIRVQLQIDSPLNDDVKNEDTNSDGGILDNILRTTGITNMKASDFVCLDKDLAVTATFDSIQQMVEDRRDGEKNDE